LSVETYTCNQLRSQEFVMVGRGSGRQRKMSVGETIQKIEIYCYNFRSFGVRDTTYFSSSKAWCTFSYNYKNIRPFSWFRKSVRAGRCR